MIFGVAMLFGFLGLLAFAAIATNIVPPSDTQQTDPKAVAHTPPFDHPGLRRLAGGSYEAYYVAQVFSFNPAVLTVPQGAKVTFYVTSTDVVHGFFVPGTDINMMVIPGWVNSQTHVFRDAGEYLLICHEYCGIGHQNMCHTGDAGGGDPCNAPASLPLGLCRHRLRGHRLRRTHRRAAPKPRI